MVHGLRLRDGAAEWYRNRWVRSPEVAAALGEPAPPSPYPDDVQIFAANTNVIEHAGKTFAIVEAGAPPIELTDELDTIGPSNFSGTLEHPFSAHPKRDPGTGELHVVAYLLGLGQQDPVHEHLAGRSRAAVGGRRDAGRPDGARHGVHREVRAAVRPAGDVRPRSRDGRQAAPVLVERRVRRAHRPAAAGRRATDGSDVQWFDIEPCYFYHPLNAYDLDDGRVVLDAVRHPKMFATDLHGPNEGATRLDRWTIDPAEGKVLEETLDDRSQEFPRLNENLQGQRNRYGYGATFGSLDAGGGPAIKHDLVAGTTVEHDYGDGRVTLEPVFVPREGATAEDDGWVMSYVYDATTDRSDVVILDAQDFTGDPVATDPSAGARPVRLPRQLDPHHLIHQPSFSARSRRSARLQRAEKSWLERRERVGRLTPPS